MRELSLDVNGVRYAVQVTVEERAGVRASIGARGVRIRIPSRLGASERDAHVSRLLAWARGRLARRSVRGYEDGMQITVLGRSVTIQVYASSVSSRGSPRNTLVSASMTFRPIFRVVAM